jgi:CO/xanthine dehydrogenase Mo-binding subunit
MNVNKFGGPVQSPMLVTHNAQFITQEMQRAAKRTGMDAEKILMRNAFQEGPYTCVALDGPGNRTGVGMSKCRPEDTYDSQIGMSIAIFRAMRHLSEMD